MHRLSPINAIHASSRVIEYAGRCKIIGNNSIVESDHECYVIAAALEDYFDEELGECDNVNKATLNPSKRSHWQNFVKEIEQQVEIFKLEVNLERMQRACLNEGLRSFMK